MGVDKYQFFENNASTVGELGPLNYLLRVFGRPMTPVEMSWTMSIASCGKISINPTLRFKDETAYNHICNNKPAIRLCSSKGGLHWTLAYSAKQTGNRAWRNYYFLQIDNGQKVDVPNPKDMDDGNNYNRVDWWNPWLMVSEH